MNVINKTSYQIVPRQIIQLLLLLQPFYGPLDFVRDYPGEPVPERLNQEGKTNLDLLEQELVSGSGISRAICKSASHPRQITTPASHYSDFIKAGCPSCRPTNSDKALKTTRRIAYYYYYYIN